MIMNTLIAWGAQLAVGVPAIDRQHQELIRIANELYIAMKRARGRDALKQLVIDLANYTNWHFAFEEKLMLEHEMPNAAQHEREHAKLKKIVTELAEKAKSGRLEITLGTMNFLRSWLSHHIQHTDKELAEFLRQAGKARRPNSG